MKNRSLSMLLIFTVAAVITICSLVSVFAEYTTAKDTVEIVFGDTHKEVIKTGEGEINYSWEILGYDDDKNHFIIKSEDGLIKNLTDNGNASGRVAVEAGEYTFQWQNNNVNGSFRVKYRITFSEPEKEEELGCYSSLVIAIGLGVIAAFWVYGLYSRRR